MSVGLFIPLPKGLAAKFPSLGDHDTSPPHATLLYFGDAPEDTERFLDVVRSHLQRWPGEITATLRGLNHFDNPDATVAYDSVRFDADMAGLRASLIAHLSDNGFPSTDRSPTYYYPHVTLAYLPPNSVGEYRGPVPEGSWTFGDVEVWGLGEEPVVLPLGRENASRVAARYKSKKKIETKDGDEATVYEYGPRQVANRHKEKAERVEHLRQHISDLRARVKDDLKSDDPMTQMTALAVSLMDHTCERVGNDDSADDGHYGVTGWLKKHITIRDGKATIKYVGKSGVKHEKTVDDGPTVTALKELCEGRDGDEAIFDTDDAKVSADEVNDYLAEFDVTAKDIRGYRANDEMCKALRAERAKGPKELPRARKEKDEILKAEFNRALEHVAEVVGHTESILRSSYLVPGLEDQYVHDGTVIKSLKVGTKTDAEREDEATEKLVKPSPKKKPPRHDLRNERVESDDPDLDDTDDDLSLNFKKVAGEVFVRQMAVRVAARYLRAEEKEDDAFLEWAKDRTFKHPETKNDVAFKSLPDEAQKKERENWAKSQKDKGEGGDKSDEADAKAKAKAEKAKADAEKKKVTPATDEDIRESVNRVVGLDAMKDLPEDEQESISRTMQEALEGYTQSEVEDFNKQVTKNLTNLHGALSKEGIDRDTVDNLRRVPEGLYPPSLKMGTFDSKKSSEAISSFQKKLSEVRKQREEAEEAIENLPSEITNEEQSQKDLKEKIEKYREDPEGTSTVGFETFSNKTLMARAERDLKKSEKYLSDSRKKLENAKKRVESLRKEEKGGVRNLTEMAAFHTQQEVLNAQVVRVKPDVNKSSEDRMRESLSRYEALPPSQQKSRIENASKHRDEVKELYENASNSEREALKKELDAAEDEMSVATLAKYRGMTPKEVEGDTKAGFVRDLDAAGVKVNDPHLQALLREDADEEDVSRAVWNLADSMPDEVVLKHFHPDAYEAFKDDPDLLDLLRDEASETLVEEFTKGRSKGKKKPETKPESKSEIEQITEDESPETAELMESWFAGGSGKGPSKKKVQTMTNMVDSLSPENKKRFVEKVEEKMEGSSSKKPEKPLAQRAREFVQNMDIPPDEKQKKLRELSKMSPDDMKAMMGAVLEDEEGEGGKTASPLLATRVVSRFLSYSMRSR